MAPRDLDEDDVPVRAGTGSRARTRKRPAYADALPGLVVAVDRGRYTCRLTTAGVAATDVGAGDGVLVVAVRAGALRRAPVVVGDRVDVAGDTTGGSDTLARIVRVAERRSLLRRTADDTDPQERPVVANADQLVVVVALADPPPGPGLIDRCLVAAYDGGLEPVLCLTKADLALPDALLEEYRPFGLHAVATTRAADDPGVAALRKRLRHRTSVLFGHSGVGKSTLVNRLVPGAGRLTAEVNEVTGRGRHRSSSVVALPLPGGGVVIDTPGIRSFGLGAVAPERVLAAFPDLAEGARRCPPGCPHTPSADRCALEAWAADGHADPRRLASLWRLLLAREGAD